MSTDETYPTTQKDFDYFKSEFLSWVKKWGLLDWEIWFDRDERDDCRACVYIDEVGRIVKVVLASEWQHPFDDEEISRVAFHEARELFYGVITKTAMNRYSTEAQLNEATHTCIRIDENTIWEDYWMGKKGKKSKKAKAVKKGKKK